VGSELTIGDVVRIARQARGVSARALSLAAGLSESAVGKIEHHQSEPTLRAFAQIAVALDLTPTEIAFLVRLAANRPT
jgi:transcriptional regulator with XRE-family HTH domain